MMKKIFLVLSTLMFMCSACFAESMSEKVAQAAFIGEVKKVAILMDAPVTYADNERIREMVPQKASEIFKKPKFEILSFEESQMMKKIYREENNMITIDYATSITPLKMADVKALGENLGADYVLLLNVTNSAPRVGAGLFSVSFKTTITCDARLMDVNAGKYIMMKQTVKDGKSTAVLAGIPSFDKAYQEALEKSLTELQINTANL